MSVWASYGLRGADKRMIENTVREVLTVEGHAAAATWALHTRPTAHLDLDFLATSLVRGWDEGVNYVRTGDVIKAFKRWRG